MAARIPPKGEGAWASNLFVEFDADIGASAPSRRKALK